MQRLTIAVMIFILSMLFSGCAAQQELSMEIKKELNDLLDIQPIEKEKECQKIPLYEIPPKKYCAKNLTLKQCFLYQYNIAKEVRYIANKQHNVVEIKNKEL